MSRLKGLKRMPLAKYVVHLYTVQSFSVSLTGEDNCGVPLPRRHDGSSKLHLPFYADVRDLLLITCLCISSPSLPFPFLPFTTVGSWNGKARGDKVF